MVLFYSSHCAGNQYCRFPFSTVNGQKKSSGFCDFLIFRTKQNTETTSSPKKKKKHKNVTRDENYFSGLSTELEITMVIKEGLLTFMSWKDPYSQMP